MNLKKMKTMAILTGMALLLAISIPLIGTTSQPQNQAVVLDNEHVQSFRGRLGIWEKTQGQSLGSLAYKYKTTLDEIREYNGNKRSGYVFIPMGLEYYHKEVAQGNGRRIILADANHMIWPIEKVYYTSRFGPRYGGMHTGLDIACGLGTPVLAAEDGTVTHSGWFGALGNAIAIYHPATGLRTWYGHNTTLLLETGEKVRKGQILAFSGSTGRSTGPHLHFEVRYNTVMLDPEDFVLPGYKRPTLVEREESPLDVREYTTFIDHELDQQN
ncbi:MAG: peptidoglycan DD-metalloendopeptidase family protein [Leptospiraceae bacterium]|nr:peptidoglycan DD-metalloendopeptidase family protein [Leptospiraceae bacterium]